MKVKFKQWLRREVTRLQKRIEQHPVFSGEAPASQDQLKELKELITIYRFLEQQLAPTSVHFATPRLVTQEVEIDHSALLV